MRNMSFALTVAQIRARTKGVTRRLGSLDAKVGDLRQPIVKGQGIPKGGHVERINGPIRFVSVRRERLWTPGQYGRDEAAREGFPEMEFRAFAEFFCAHNGCALRDRVTRIEFEYVEVQS